jgi:hypothetical protein
LPDSLQAVSPSSKNHSSSSSEEILVMFDPPKGWRTTDVSETFPSVKILVFGKGEYPYPPSIALSTEPFEGTLKQYLIKIKARNEARGYEWKDLGTIQTQSGPARLSQVDEKSEWGDIRYMHAILSKNGQIYILMAAAIKHEFSRFYKDFFEAMHSMRVGKDPWDLLEKSRQTQLKNEIQKLKEKWQALFMQEKQSHPHLTLDNLKEELFKGESFQRTAWLPFKQMLVDKFSKMGSEWQVLILQSIEKELFEINQ